MLEKAYYRSFQAVFNVGSRCMNWPTPTLFTGPRSIEKIPELLNRENVRNVMVVTGPSVGKKLAPKYAIQLIETIIDQKLYLENGCDGFLAIGGGSPIDAAKGAAARVVRPKAEVGQMAGLLKVIKKIPPFIAVPTTAGTGSETTIAAVITDSETHHKYAIMDLKLVPKYAILDPELTRELPPKITATTGMDALTHAVEAYTNLTYNTDETIRMSEEAVCEIFRYLERAYGDGNDMEARTQMLIASYKAGFAFTRACVGNVHAIAHTLGGLYNTPHGLANAVILPIVLEDYGEAVYEKLAHLAELTGLKDNGSVEEKAKAFIAEIRDMNRRMGIPTGFDFIKEEDIPQMITWALAETNPFYPVPVIYDRKRCEAVIRRIISEAL